MATDVDNFSDLELSDEETELHTEFIKASDHLKSLASKLDNKTLLELYAHYKQGLEGDCNIPRPGFFDARGRQKWDAWNALVGVNNAAAKQKYIDLVQRLDPLFKPSVSSNSKTKDESWVSVSTLAKEDVEMQTDKTILDYVKEREIKELEQLLKDKPEQIDFEDSDGMKAVHWAADRGFADVLSKLLEHGARVDCLDKAGQTALHYAVSCGHIDCAKLLLEAGASVEIADECGDTAVDLVTDEAFRNLLLNKTPDDKLK